MRSCSAFYRSLAGFWRVPDRRSKRCECAAAPAAPFVCIVRYGLDIVNCVCCYLTCAVLLPCGWAFERLTVASYGVRPHGAGKQRLRSLNQI